MTVLLTLAGGVALMIWGLYMVKTGILRTFGAGLRRALSTRLKNRFAGFCAGFGLAALLQSSTAAALLVAGLQKKGLVTTATALACVLGADLGSAFVVRLLTLDLSGFVPVLILAGVVLFIRRPNTRRGQFGRILLGLAFVMTALEMIVGATAPVRESAFLAGLLETIGAMPAASALLGAALALLCFSSLAVVAIASGAVASGVLAPEGGLWVVLGANLGSALLAFISTLQSSATARRAPTGNLFFRCAAFAVAAPALLAWPVIGTPFLSADGVVEFHLLFNSMTGAAGLFFIGPVAKRVERMLPDAAPVYDEEVRIFTPENLVVAPAAALTLVADESAKTAGFLRRWWIEIEPVLYTNPPAGVLMNLHDQARVIERRCAEVEKFLNALLRKGLPAPDVAAWNALNNRNDNLVFGKEMVELVLSELESRKCVEQCFFTREGLEELRRRHAEITGEWTELEAILSGAVKHPKRMRRELLARIRGRDEETHELLNLHLARVAAGRAGAIETSTLHVNLLLLFRRVEAAIAVTLDRKRSRWPAGAPEAGKAAGSVPDAPLND